MTLSPEESDLMERIIRFAIQKGKLGLAEHRFPGNLAPIIEKWKNDKHEFRLDGVALLGFCMVTRKNVEVLLKEVKEASEKINLDLRILLSHQELCTEIGELPECDVTKVAKFTAEKDKITIKDAHADFWRLQTNEGDFDDLEPLDESLFQEMFDDVEPQYPELTINTSYIEYDHELPLVSENLSTSTPNSPPTLGLIHVNCQDTLEDVDTAPHTMLTAGYEDVDFYQGSPEATSPIVSPPIPASQTMSPERYRSPELHLEPLLLTSSSDVTSEAVRLPESPIPPKKPRLLTLTSSKPRLNDLKIQKLLKQQDSELQEALKALRIEIQKTSKRPESSLQMTSPVRAYLDGLEPVDSEFRRPEFWVKMYDDDDDKEDGEPVSRDSGIQEDVPSSDDVICALEDVEEHTDTVIEDVREDFFDSEGIFVDSEFDFLNLKDFDSSKPQNAPNFPEEPEKSSEDVKNELRKAVEGADGKPISLLASIAPSASRKSAARAFFAVLEMTKTRELAPPTQNEPFGDIFLSKNVNNC